MHPAVLEFIRATDLGLLLLSWISRLAPYFADVARLVEEGAAYWEWFPDGLEGACCTRMLTMWAGRWNIGTTLFVFFGWAFS